MKMLIAVSSKHGSTREIASSIGETVRETGIEVDVVDAQDVESVALAWKVMVAGGMGTSSARMPPRRTGTVTATS